MLRNPAEGGISLEVTGPQGSGKTSLLFHIWEKIIEKNPDELTFMYDSIESPVMFNRVKNWRIFAEPGLDLTFRDIIRNKFIDYPYYTFKDYEDIYINARPKYINVIYFKNLTSWIPFLNFLRRSMHRAGHKFLDPEGPPVWKTVIWDEYEDIAPANEPNPIWTFNRDLANNEKNTRKGLVTKLVDTQNRWDVDHRVRGKLMLRAYLKGAYVDKNSRIKQIAVDSIKSLYGQRQALIEWAAIYGKIRFKAYPPIDPIFEVIQKEI